MLSGRKELVYSSLPSGGAVTYKEWERAFKQNAGMRELTAFVFTRYLCALVSEGLVDYVPEEINMRGVIVRVDKYRRASDKNSLEKLPKRA